jgi:hypothetical protein
MSWFLQSSYGGIESPEAVIRTGVGVPPRGFGLDPVPDTHAGGHGLVDVPEDTGRDTAEQSRTVGGPFLDCRAFERDSEHRGDDAKPEVAPRAAAGGPPDARLDAELLQGLQRVTQSERDALEHGPDERAPVVAER